MAEEQTNGYLVEALVEGRRALAVAIIANAGGLFTNEDVGEHTVIAKMDAAIARATVVQP